MAPEPGTSAKAVVLLISCDPRTDHRALEALRIGVGLAAAGSDVVIILADGALHLLDDDTDDVVDGDEIVALRQALRRLGIPLHVDDPDRPCDVGEQDPAPPILPLTRTAIVEHLTRARRTLVFP